MARRGQVRLTVFGTGLDGLRLAARLSPDLVLLDLHLPDLTGETVLGRLLALPGWGSRPVVVLSADALPATVARLRAAGALDYLTKPLHFSRLYSCLDAVQAARQRQAPC